MYVGFDFLLIIRVGLCVRQCQVWWICMKEVSSFRWRCVAPFRVFSKAATFSSVDEAIRIVHNPKTHIYTDMGGRRRRETRRNTEKGNREARGREKEGARGQGERARFLQPRGDGTLLSTLGGNRTIWRETVGASKDIICQMRI